MPFLLFVCLFGLFGMIDMSELVEISLSVSYNSVWLFDFGSECFATTFAYCWRMWGIRYHQLDIWWWFRCSVKLPLRNDSRIPNKLSSKIGCSFELMDNHIAISVHLPILICWPVHRQSKIELKTQRSNLLFVKQFTNSWPNLINERLTKAFE